VEKAADQAENFGKLHRGGGETRRERAFRGGGGGLGAILQLLGVARKTDLKSRAGIPGGSEKTNQTEGRVE